MRRVEKYRCGAVDVPVALIGDDVTFGYLDVRAKKEIQKLVLIIFFFIRFLVMLMSKLLHNRLRKVVLEAFTCANF